MGGGGLKFEHLLFKCSVPTGSLFHLLNTRKICYHFAETTNWENIADNLALTIKKRKKKEVTE
jgi:hypothetical protein